MEKMSMGRLRIKYKKADLNAGPGVTTGLLGQLKKGAVVDITEDASQYYYKVRLDNGLEGYIYKPAGELTNLPLTKITEKEVGFVSDYIPSNNQMTNGVSVEDVPINDIGKVRPARTSIIRTAAIRTPASENGRRPSRGLDKAGSRLNPTSLSVVITSAEIAVFDAPGIVGRQVAKLRRGERVALLNQDGFFYQVQLPNGISGYIPRYAAENQ